MGNGGLSVTIHIDRDLARQYRHALVRERRRRWIGILASYAALGSLGVWLSGIGDSWGYLSSVAIGVGTLGYWEWKWFRREAALPLDRDLTADFGEASLRVEGPGYRRELPYAFFRDFERDGVLVRLRDGANQRWCLPGDLFTPETEVWFRHHEQPRNLAAEPLPAGTAEFGVSADLPHRLALVSVLRNDLRDTVPAFAVFAVISVLAARLVDPLLGAFLIGAIGVTYVVMLVADYNRLYDRLRFQYDRGPVRAGPEDDAWVIDSVNHRERIDPAEVTFFQRRKGKVFLRHTTAGEEHRVVFPEEWVAGLLVTERSTEPAI